MFTLNRKPLNKVGRVPGTARPKPSQVEIRCKNCGKRFYVHPYRLRQSVKACSHRCAGELRRNRSKQVCAFCKQEFERSVSQVRWRGAKYCSKDCSNKGMIAETAAKPIRDRYGRTRRRADRLWQKAVRERDEYTCQRCGKVEQYIHAHHVSPRSQRPDLKHDVSNGKCLCNSCHQWVHMHPVEAKELGLLNVSETYEVARATGHRVDNALMTYKGETLYMAQWARRLGVDRGALEARRARGWPDDKIITTPVKPAGPPTLLTYQGRTMRLTEWSRELGIQVVTLRARMNAGWSPERIVETRPVYVKRE